MMNYQYLKLLCLLTCSAVIYQSLPAIAQMITPAADGTGTVINRQGEHFNIEGGSYNSDRRNLFHSFEQFNLNPGQTANFITAPQVQNILGKVKGGETSLINGLLQVTGSQANLFLINPAGIIFGSQARLNLPAAFTATTANALKFDQFWLNVVGEHNYSNLLNYPTAYSFDQTQPAMIINQGNLSLLPAQSLNLFGHAVLNTGTMSVPGGNITITAIAPDQHILKVSPIGHVLNWELTTNRPADFFQQTHNLPALLTGPMEQIPADIIRVNEQGQIVLQSNSEIILSGRAIASGNIDASDLNPGKTGGVVNIFADQVQVINSNIQANGDYSGGIIRLGGGDIQGKGILPTARQTLIDTQSQINANAITLGNGGEIVIASQENTNFAGTVRAIAGQLSGNGGVVEISSQNNLVNQGNIDVSSTNGQAGQINIKRSPLITSSQLEETLPDIEIPTFPEPPTIPPPDNNTGTIPNEPEPAVTEPEIPSFPETPNIPLPGDNTDPNNPQQDISIPSIPPFPNVPNIPPPGNNIVRPEDGILTPTIPNFPAPPNIPLPGDNTGGPGQGVGIPTIPNFPSPPNIQPPGSTTGEIITSPNIPNFPAPPNLRPPNSTDRENFVPEPIIPGFPSPPNLRPPSSGTVTEKFIPEPIIPDFPAPPNITPPPSQGNRDNVTRVISSLQLERKTQVIDTNDLNNQNLQNNLNILGKEQNLLIINPVVLPSVSNENVIDVTSNIDNIMTDQFTQHLNTEFNNNFSSIETVQTNLQKVAEQTGKKPAIIYVILRSDQIDLIIVPPDREKITYRSVSNVTREQVLNTANDLRKEITNPVKRNTKSYLPFAQQMYEWMITPLLQDLQDLEIDTLGFILDSGLRTLPIATLHDGEKFIIEKYSIGLIPSVNLVNMTYRSLEDAHILAMGASQFTELNPLPAVPLELSTITTEWQGRYFLNRDFTFNNLLKSRQAYPYRIIHLATHGEFSPGDLSNSFIQLWNEKLRLDQLRKLKWSNPPVDLLVLSACRTAVGDETVELGFAGLAVQAGAKSALASLWYVSDAGTLGFMADFYRYLQSASIKAEALRSTQIDMIEGRIRIKAGSIERDSFRGAAVIPLPAELSDTNDQVLSHPYYWAAFTMIGSPW